MKLEMLFNPNDPLEGIVESAKAQIERMVKQYTDSLKRHSWLVAHMMEKDGSYNRRYNEEAEGIEAMWTRMGVEF